MNNPVYGAKNIRREPVKEPSILRNIVLGKANATDVMAFLSGAPGSKERATQKDVGLIDTTKE